MLASLVLHVIIRAGPKTGGRSYDPWPDSEHISKVRSWYCFESLESAAFEDYFAWNPSLSL